MAAIRSWLKPHRIGLILVAAAILLLAAFFLRWDWIPAYAPLLPRALWTTLWLLVASCGLGFVLALGLGFAQAAGPSWLSLPARTFCTVIRGTPLLLQLWLLYYGLGSLFPQFPWIRQSELWPYLRQAWPYGLAALTISFAAYEGEVMRGAFAGVPRGQLESARAFGMKRFTIFRRIWMPQAVTRALPTLLGETVIQLKSTPLVATITMIDIFAVASRASRDTLITYEPLLLVALVYMILTGILVFLFRKIEARIPARLG